MFCNVRYYLYFTDTLNFRFLVTLTWEKDVSIYIVIIDFICVLYISFIGLVLSCYIMLIINIDIHGHNWPGRWALYPERVGQFQVVKVNSGSVFLGYTPVSKLCCHGCNVISWSECGHCKRSLIYLQNNTLELFRVKYMILLLHNSVWIKQKSNI